MRHQYLKENLALGLSNPRTNGGRMAVIIGILAFVVLLCCAVILRERKLRRGWQRVLERVLQERGDA